MFLRVQLPQLLEHHNFLFPFEDRLVRSYRKYLRVCELPWLERLFWGSFLVVPLGLCRMSLPRHGCVFNEERNRTSTIKLTLSSSDITHLDMGETRTFASVCHSR